ncbi:hypothetical protein PHISCL_01544 [Aspergillus sclerotialis]|uniref:Uncharacterized protein n=1 Tax=Aspergillus sclerotialis TaxID=2070753 RepID=A0A3A3A9S0_9EURO|nr:hypothetical protein PHISCL_01544 [Aspergillus sclerotialis]
MASMDNPPAYFCPSGNEQVKTLKSPNILNSGEEDLKICPYPHQVLVSITSKESQTALTALHHWDPTLKSSVCIPTHLTPDGLQYIRGFKDLGIFKLAEADVSDAEAVHECLTSHITGSSSSESGLIASIVESLREKAELPAANVSSSQLFIITVYSSSESQLLGKGSVPQWKWAKPESVYSRKSGHWEADVSRAVENGEFEGGRNLYLLVR